MTDIMAQALSQILNAEKRGNPNCVIKPVSKLLREVLAILNEEGFIGEFEVIDDGRGGILNLKLIGEVNGCGAIKPRFSPKLNEFEKFEKRYLPSKDFGILILSTTKGVMTHKKAKKEKVGGQLLAYVY